MSQVDSQMSAESPDGVELNHAGGQADPDALNADDRNVIDTSEDNSSEDSSSSPLTQLPPLPMPGAASLTSLKLHSPSHIVGTPFAVNASPFEYPFPETGSSSSSASADDFTLPRSLPSTVFPISSYPSLPAVSPPLIGFPITNQSPPSGSSFHISPKNAPHYPLSHPKLLLSEADKEPPVPPGLLKHRHRWSMGLLGKRKKQNGDAATVGSFKGTTGSDSIESGATSPQDPPVIPTH